MRINLLSFFAVSREDKEMIIKVVGDNPKFLEVSTEYILKKCISCYNYKTGQYWDTSVEQVVIAYCNEVNNCIRLVPQTYTSGLYIRLVPQACTSDLYIRLVHQTCTSGLYIRLVHQTCTSDLYIRLVHQACTSDLYIRLVLTNLPNKWNSLSSAEIKSEELLFFLNINCILF